MCHVFCLFDFADYYSMPIVGCFVVLLFVHDTKEVQDVDSFCWSGGWSPIKSIFCFRFC